MKVSKDMKIFIIISFMCLVIYVVISITTKILSSFALVKVEYDQIYTNYENMYKNFVTNKYYKDLEKELLDEKCNYNVLSNVKQEEIMKILYEHLSSCNINLNKYNFTEVFPLSLNQPLDDSVEEIENNNQTEIVIMSINIEFNCNYENMLKFIDKLQTNAIDMSITNINITFYKDEIVFVIMDINFYASS